MEKNFALLRADRIEKILENLSQLTFEVTDACNLCCKYCGYGEYYDGYDKREDKLLSMEQAVAILEYMAEKWSSKYSSSHRKKTYISFYGGEPLMNMKLIKEIVTWISDKNISHCHFVFTMTTNAILLDKHINFLTEHDVKILVSLDGDILDVLYSIKKLGIENISILMYVKSDFNKELFDKVQNFLQSEEINHEYEFWVTDEKEFDEIETKTQDITPELVNIKPVFDGSNYAFFENNIYIDESDIQNIEVTKKNIFAHQALNTNDFGKLTITADGKVYANPHFPALGTVDDDIRLLVHKEMIAGTSWRRIRDIQPCCDCVYQWLCPSPSDYETVIGKPNLCHVMP